MGVNCDTNNDDIDNNTIMATQNFFGIHSTQTDADVISASSYCVESTNDNRNSHIQCDNNNYPTTNPKSYHDSILDIDNKRASANSKMTADFRDTILRESKLTL